MFAFSHRRVVFDYTSKISQACGATEKAQALTGRARSPGALFLTVSEGGTKPKKLQIFPLPHKTPLKDAKSTASRSQKKWPFTSIVHSRNGSTTESAERDHGGDRACAQRVRICRRNGRAELRDADGANDWPPVTLVEAHDTNGH